MAGATGEPQGVASAEVEGLEALVSGQTKVLEADVVRAQSNSDCINDPNGQGTIIVGLKVLGTSIAGPINGAFPPNFQPPAPVSTALAALGLTLIINEQHPAATGRGFVVNGLHLFDAEPATLPVGALFNGDLIISHAATAVNCPNGRGSTGLATSPVIIEKSASKPTARPGEEFTYTARVQNKSTQGCRVNQFIDHLAEPFEFVSTAGAFGTVAVLENRAAGGTDIVLKPVGVTVAPNAFATQTFTVKVKADAKPGVYFNNTEILCANLGNFIGIDAPVEVPGAAQRQPQCSDGVDNDGDGKIDFPADPGCDSRQDDDERNFQCSDRVDNDGDGKIDFPNDPGCSSPQDDSEVNSLPRTGANGVTFLLGGLLLAAAIGVRRFRTAL